MGLGHCIFVSGPGLCDSKGCCLLVLSPNPVNNLFRDASVRGMLRRGRLPLEVKPDLND